MESAREYVQIPVKEEIANYLKPRAGVAALLLAFGSGLFTGGMFWHAKKELLAILGSTSICIGALALANFFSVLWVAKLVKKGIKSSSLFPIEHIGALYILFTVLILSYAGIAYGGVHYGLNTLIPQDGLTHMQSKLIEFGLGFGLGLIISGVILTLLITKPFNIKHEELVYDIEKESKTQTAIVAILRAIYYGAATGLSVISGSLITEAAEITGKPAIAIEFLFSVTVIALALAIDLLFTNTLQMILEEKTQTI